MDVLGFKDLIRRAEQDKKINERLRNLFYEVIPKEISYTNFNEQSSTRDIKKAFPKELEMSFFNASDSFFISAPVLKKPTSYPALIAVSIKSIQIAQALVKMGLLVRGGIAVGNIHRVYVNDDNGKPNNIMGTALNEAVEAEKNANAPIINLFSPTRAQKIRPFKVFNICTNRI